MGCGLEVLGVELFAALEVGREIYGVVLNQIQKSFMNMWGWLLWNLLLSRNAWGASLTKTKAIIMQ